MTQEEDGINEQVGLSPYRIDAGLIVGYAVACLGLLVFGWDPRYVFLGVGSAAAMANVGLIIKAFMTARKVTPMLVATVLCLPALLVCIGLAAMAANQLTADGDPGTGDTGTLLLGAFLSSTLYSEWQRFRRVTLPQARFARYFDDKYVFENGERIFNGVSHVLGAVIESWLLTVVLAISWIIAAIAGASAAGDDAPTWFNATAAAVLLTLCLLRQLATIGLLHAVYRDSSNQEELWLKTFSKTGTIVLRDPR